MKKLDVAGCRRIDALVAQHIMGYERAEREMYMVGRRLMPLPGFTTDPEYAWVVVNQLRVCGYQFDLSESCSAWTASFDAQFTSGGKTGVGEGDSAFVAIASAALDTQGVCVEEIFAAEEAANATVVFN